MRFAFFSNGQLTTDNGPQLVVKHGAHVVEGRTDGGG